ncbi:MAG: hypothetical protein SGPRY_001596 [Prymnesium sp.]
MAFGWRLARNPRRRQPQATRTPRGCALPSSRPTKARGPIVGDDVTAELGAERRRVLKVLRRVRRDLAGVNERLKAIRPPHIHDAPQVIDAALVHAFACAVCSPDSDLAALFVVETSPRRDGGRRPEIPRPSTSIGWTTEKWTSLLEGRMRRKLQIPLHREAMQTVQAKTLSEVERGLAAVPFSRAQLDSVYGEGAWRPMERFGVIQKALRQCAGIWLQRRHYHEREAQPLMGSTDDLADAYRHVPCADPRFTGVAVPDPDTGRVGYFTMSGFNFGLNSAVLCFNRFPECMTAVAR